MTMMPALISGYAATPTLTAEPLDVTALALVLELTEPELTAAVLPGESPEQFAARHAAAADIVDDVLFEYGSAA